LSHSKVAAAKHTSPHLFSSGIAQICFSFISFLPFIAQININGFIISSLPEFVHDPEYVNLEDEEKEDEEKEVEEKEGLC